MLVINAINLIVLALCSVVGFVLTILSIYRLHQSWNDPWLVERNKYLVVSLLVCCIIDILINTPHTISCALSYGHKPMSWPFEAHLWMSLMQNLSVYGILVGYVGKIFSLYFKHGYEEAASSMNWNKPLRRQPSHHNSNWFIQHKQKYGDPFYLALRLMTVWIFLVVIIETIFMIQWFVFHRVGFVGIINVFAACIAIMISLRMWRSFPVIHDAFHIQDNILFTIRLQASVMMVLIPVGVAQIFIDDLWLSLSAVATFAFCLFEYCVILHPQQLINRRVFQMSLQSVEQNNWRDIIRDRDGFDAFMKFLQSKFASESLLFLAEYVQFKQILSAHKLLDIARLEQDEVVVDIPEDLPLSSIMADLDTKLGKVRNWRSQFWIAIRALNDRYIKDGADLELNIDYKLKRTMDRLTKEKRDSDHRKDTVLRTLQSIYQGISRILDGSFMEFNDSSVAKAYYIKEKNKEKTFIPRLDKAVALWNLTSESDAASISNETGI